MLPQETITQAITERTTRAPQYDLYRDYEQGRHKHPYATKAFRNKYGWVLSQARLNACAQVRTNFTDLVQIQAWAGEEAEQAENISDTTDLPRTLDLAINESWRCGDAYILVWPDADGNNRAWFHRADQVIVHYDPERPGHLLNAVKIWVDDNGHGRANIYTPTTVHRYISSTKLRHTPTSAVQWENAKSVASWHPYTDSTGTGDITHNFGQVPFIHLPYDPQTEGGTGRSILRDIIPLQDGLNHAAHAIIISTEKQAREIRVLFNYTQEHTLNPITGQFETKPLQLDDATNSILGVPGPGPMQQFEPVTPTGLLAIKREYFTDIANTVGMPVSDIVPDLGNIPSGAALRVLAARRTRAVKNYTRSITGALTNLMKMLGANAYPEWADPSPTDDTEKLANAQARLDLGYPLAEILPDLGEAPEDIERITTGAAQQTAAYAAAGRELLTQAGVMNNGNTGTTRD